jgi:cysteine synthase
MGVGLALRCPQCGASTSTATRTAFSIFQEHHLTACGASWVAIDGTLEDVLALPPYDDSTGADDDWTNGAAAG